MPRYLDVVRHLNIVVLVRCMHCMKDHVRWNNPNGIVFIPSTLIKYAHMTCEHCGNVGLEIYIGEDPQ